MTTRTRGPEGCISFSCRCCLWTLCTSCCVLFPGKGIFNPPPPKKKTHLRTAQHILSSLFDLVAVPPLPSSSYSKKEKSSSSIFSVPSSVCIQSLADIKGTHCYNPTSSSIPPRWRTKCSIVFKRFGLERIQLLLRRLGWHRPSSPSVIFFATRRGEDDAPLRKNLRGSKWDHIFGPHAAKIYCSKWSGARVSARCKNTFTL